MSSCLARVTAVALAFSLGCAPPPLKTCVVTGTVAYKSKGDKIRPLTGGRVSLESLTDPKTLAFGEIEEDGTFTLHALVNGKSYANVPPGEYRGCVQPPGYADEDNDEDRAKRARGVINARYLNAAKSGLKFQIGPGDTTITIEVEK